MANRASPVPGAQKAFIRASRNLATNRHHYQLRKYSSRSSVESGTAGWGRGMECCPMKTFGRSQHSLNTSDHFLRKFSQIGKARSKIGLLDGLNPFLSSALCVEIAQAFSHRPDFAIADRACIDLNHARQLAHRSSAENFLRAVNVDPRQISFDTANLFCCANLHHRCAGDPFRATDWFAGGEIAF